VSARLGACLLLLVDASASGQPCVLCRTERCPTKADVPEWCGAGRDPLARPPPVTPARRHPPRPSAACPPGQLPAADTPDHCCWPGQRYSASAKRCVGAPSECPPERAPVGESCEPRAAVAAAGGSPCPAGMAYLGGGRLAGATGPVEVVAFCIDRDEVTVAEYLACVHDFKCSPPADRAGCDAARGPAGDLPVSCVSAAEGAAFCANRGARLPTALEWEWAARGGHDGWSWPWGEAPPDGRVCWDGTVGGLGAGERLRPCAVGSHPEGSSPQGVADLAGNVAEWTLDGGGGGGGVLARGGSWASFHVERIRPASAVAAERDRRDPYTGFRCAATPSPAR
jgi:hypothetical protein